jgi:N-acetylmuramidase
MITEEDYKKLSSEFNIPSINIKKVVKVESGGIGFSKETGKIIIQFEPSWFKRKSPYTPSGKWSLNKVEKQTAEWEAFNNAFSKNKNAAMESTSIGLMQVMGFHWKLTGFKSVGEMWDYAKESETNQLRLGLLFIVSNTKMYKALKIGDWETFAYYYNGAQWRKFNYAERLEKA